MELGRFSSSAIVEEAFLAIPARDGDIPGVKVSRYSAADQWYACNAQSKTTNLKAWKRQWR